MAEVRKEGNDDMSGRGKQKCDRMTAKKIILKEIVNTVVQKLGAEAYVMWRVPPFHSNIQPL